MANVPTTVFTPLEYGACGLSEESAMEQLGADAVEVFHSAFTPLEWQLSIGARQEGSAYAKVVCDATDDMKVLGLHLLGPNVSNTDVADCSNHCFRCCKQSHC